MRPHTGRVGFAGSVSLSHSNVNRDRSCAALTALLMSVGVCVRTCAEGFRNPPAGAFNLGRAGGRIAQIDDSSAVAQNPANLMDLQGPDFVVAPSVVYIHVDYKSPSGATAETKLPWKLLPNGFAALPFMEGKFAVGLGITTPYGLSNEWDQKGAFADMANGSSLRYQAPHFTELKTINCNPTVAARLCDRVTAGVGLDVFWSELNFMQFLTPLAPTLEAKAKGDGVGVGGNLGITWVITKRQRLAVTYRSQVDVDYDGHFDLKNVAIVGTSRSDFSSRLKFPNIVAVGYGIKVSDAIRLEGDVEWIQFSRFDNLPVNVGSNPVGFPPPPSARTGRTRSRPESLEIGNLPTAGRRAPDTSSTKALFQTKLFRRPSRMAIKTSSRSHYVIPINVIRLSSRTAQTFMIGAGLPTIKTRALMAPTTSRCICSPLITGLASKSPSRAIELRPKRISFRRFAAPIANTATHG